MVTTTGILRDLVRNVGGDRVRVTSLVPDGADPHAYEPTLRSIRDVVYADVAFSNYALLEEHAIIKALDANLSPDAANVELAESSVKYAANLIQLVEDVSLDTVWLGMRVNGDGADLGATRASDVLVSATGLEAPGDLTAYLTESFGNPVFYARSADGFDPTNGYRDDTAVLPPDAHTHMSWAFTDPGVYRLDLRAALAVDDTTRPVPVGSTTVTFAVGIDPATVPDVVPGMEVRTVIDRGHADVAVDLDERSMYLFTDSHGDGRRHEHRLDPATTVIEVPNKALTEVPGDPSHRFLGPAGAPLYLLPQAVLGKHVHGEIDPHLWHDVRNAMAYVEIIRDTLTEADPAGATHYRARANRYLAELDALHAEVARTIEAIPERSRRLVTTHDAFAYLGAAYDLEIAGFVTANPATEPSLADRRRLSATIGNLDIPAVFLEPNLAARSSTLAEVAREHDIAVCPIYGDAFDDQVDTYVELMRFNARSLARCLGAPDS